MSTKETNKTYLSVGEGRNRKLQAKLMLNFSPRASPQIMNQIKEEENRSLKTTSNFHLLFNRQCSTRTKLISASLVS